MLRLVLVLCACHCLGGVAEGQVLPFCENALPPGEGFGGTVTIIKDCVWRPQLHFITALNGQQGDFAGPLEVPVVFYNPAAPVSWQSGPPRMSVSNVVLANFSLSSPGLAGSLVLWPKGLLVPGMQQQGSTVPRRLYLTDVKFLVPAQTLQEYLRFFQNTTAAVYTDNSTFLHIPYWSDAQTAAVSVGLLLAAPGVPPMALAGSRPVEGRNFVLASDQSTLPSVLQAAASVRSAQPFLVYLSTNATLTVATLRVRALPVNRPLVLVGKATDITGLNFGMEVNTLLLGPQGSITFDQLVLENLAPGDARSLALAGPYEVLMGYHLWAVSFDRSAVKSPRLMLENCTLVVSPLALDQYLFKATLYRVHPAGFTQQLQQLASYVSEWEVMWLEYDNSVITTAFTSSASAWHSVNMTAHPVIATALPLPDRSAIATAAASQQLLSEYELTHAGVGAKRATMLEQHHPLNPAGSPELIMLTTNVTFKPGAGAGDAGKAAAAPSSNNGFDTQLLRFLAATVGQQHAQQHTLMGIVTPPVTLDMSYSQDLVQLLPATPPGHLVFINVVMLHLSQGPTAASPDATVLLPDVWTHLLWGIQRSPKSVVMLSNVTLFVPAAEFSFIRSHTGEQPTSFTINLQGDANMRFYNVRDLRADGLFIQRYAGPGLEAQSLLLRVEPGWSMNGQPPRGFWANSGLPDVPDSAPSKLSDAMVVVLAASLVTAVVGSALACLAFVFWRKRAAELKRRAEEAQLEEGKSREGSEVVAGGNGAHGSSGHGGSSGLGVLGGAGGGRRGLNGILPGLLRDSMPVHDSSDSYNVPEVVDRAALTAELARSQLLGVRRSGYGQQRGGSDSDSDCSGRGARGGRQLPPAAAGGGPSTTSMASDAALQRLQSAITVMSQDVLSRRLQYALGADGSPIVTGLAGAAAGGAAAGAAAAAAGGGGLGRPSPLGLHHKQQPQQRGQQVLTVDEAGAGDGDLHHHHHQQQQHSGSLAGPLARHSSSSLASTHNGSPGSVPAAADQHDSGSGLLDADGQLRHQPQRGAAAGNTRSAAVWAAGAAVAAAATKPLSKSSLGSSAASRMGSSGGMDQLKLLELVGQGTFGQVYKALWRRRCVAVKVLQLPATAGSSDVPWKGMGRASSHREKMAVMETVVSTTMSHPNIVQVYTYVLQPLMQGSMSSSRKQLSSTHGNKKHQRHQQEQEQQQQQPELEQLPVVQQQQQVQEIELQPQQPQQQQQQPMRLQGAAAQLLARFGQHKQQQQQQQQPPLPPDSKQPPDPGSGGQAAAVVEQQQPQQQQQQQQQALVSQHSNGSLSSRGSASAGGGDDSGNSPHHRHNNSGDLSRLTPAMAKAAAAALPAVGGLEGGSTDSVSLDDDTELPVGPVLVGWEVRLVMEFCDAGSLRTALDHKLLIDRTTGLPALECVLFLAHDVACAMIHLHSEHLLHGDLKASNVLLKRTAPRLPQHHQQQQQHAGAGEAAAGATSLGERASGIARHSQQQGSQAGSLIGQGLGLMAKVADFGLSLTLEPTDTHVSQMHMGTLTHMAPELLLHGRASKASDVYAFGILLWELATGRRPYSGTPVGMLAHKVVQQGWRPAWPGGCSLPVKVLVEGCWTQDPADRPSFEQVVQQLEEMANHLDELKAQQAQAMAAAAAPLFSGPGPQGSQTQDSDQAHELTPSMMAELMPSGFGASAGVSDIEEEGQGSGVLYEMSQLSGGSVRGGDGDDGELYEVYDFDGSEAGSSEGFLAPAAAGAGALQHKPLPSAFPRFAGTHAGVLGGAAPLAAAAAAPAGGGPVVVCGGEVDGVDVMSSGGLDGSSKHSHSGGSKHSGRVAVVQ